MSDSHGKRGGIGRRGFVQQGLWATALAKFGMYGADVQAQQVFKGETLRIFTYAGAWGDQFTKNFAPLFKKVTGADIIVELGWWDSIPKLKASPAGKPAFDLIMTDATQGYPAIREGMFQKIDLAKVPNARKFAPEAMDNWVVKEQWGVTWPDAAQTGIYNTDLVKQKPKGWKDLLDAKFNAKLGMYNSFYFSLFTFACMKVDMEGKAGTARALCNSNMASVLDFAKDQSKRVKFWWPSSSDMALNLVQKNVQIGNIHSVDAFAPVRAKEPVAVFVPEQDRASFQALWLIAKDTKKTALATAAIDLFCSEAFQEIYASDGGFPTAIQSVAAKVAQKDKLWASINPATPEQFKNVGYYPYDAYFKDWARISETWDREVLRKPKKA
ncbi:MAG TPA: ABC transporter substrate-binding protein [Ramlibacter sp.]|nr:ABC transporter substrate-binding protein [Ramlibacter sp.]